MKIFDIYILKTLSIATAFIAIILTFIIFLSQSLRFLEIIMNAGAAGSVFWILTGLALPRFFEIILPLSLMSATLFLYNKMILDSELTAMRAIGHSSFALAKPAIILGVLTTIFLWCITMWVAPISLAKMQAMRVELKADFSNFLFREGVFNKVGKGLTVYIRDRSESGELQGLMIHDTRDPNKLPSTVLARRGLIVSNDNGHEVIVFDGSRQEYKEKSQILHKLAFDRYTIDLPTSVKSRQKWKEPDERTITQLLNPDITVKKDRESLREFTVEIHRRFTGPLLALAFPLMGLVALLLGPVDRRGQTIKIGATIITVIVLQSLFLSAYNISKNNNIGIILMYFITLAPIFISLFALSKVSEDLRRKTLYSKEGAA